MVRRWQLALWVLAGLVVSVVVLWDRASGSTQSADGTRVETVDGEQPIRGDAPDQLAFADLDAAPQLEGGGNMLRPTTTTTTTPTTTTSTVPETTLDESDPTGPTTTGDPATTTTDDDGSSTTTSETTNSTVPVPALETTYYQDFSAGELTPGEWILYNGAGHEGWGLRRPSAVAVVPADGGVDAAGDHLLEITARMGSGAEAGHLVSGGMKLADQTVTTGRVSFRARVDVDADQVTAGVIHLWPVDNNWPTGGEINIMSTRLDRDDRSPVWSDLHWVDADGHGSTSISHSEAGADVSAAEWHVYEMLWTDEYVAVSIDGGSPVILSEDVSHIPHGGLDLAIQLDGSDSPDLPGQQPVLNGEVRLQVDWIRIEEPVAAADT